MKNFKLKITLLVVGSCLLVFSFLFFQPRNLSDELKLQVLEGEIKYASYLDSDYCIIIDYTLPVYARRLWVLNLSSDEIVLNSHVSHAWNSGILYADTFSNIVSSEYSCAGFFKTENAYESSFGKGEYKLGMRINGLETKNDNALERSIVFHCSHSPWSSGCFMTFPKTNKRIIDSTKDGSLVFVNR